MERVKSTFDFQIYFKRRAMATKRLADSPLSILDLATVTEGHTPADSFHNSLELAKKADYLGYKRYWFAEHHNMVSVASSATAVLIGYIAGSTSNIRVGSGGIMLPNHAPLIIAEQFGTLASLYPGRIDLGLGRAPGTDQITSYALRRERTGSPNDFPRDVQELMMYFDSGNSSSPVRAIPGEGLDIPVWILGSNTDSAHLAAALGLPYAFASHFAPTHLHDALDIYRNKFRPSKHLQQPYTMACVNVIAAESSDEAARLATSFYQLAKGIITGKRKPLQPPVNSMDGIWNEFEQAAVEQMMAYSFIGNVEEVGMKLEDFLGRTAVDELMIVSHIYDPQAKIRSHELVTGMKRQS
jgi:luciferase family oxidoreductase group 1